MGRTIARFVRYASSQLRPLGVRVSVDVFGLSATHDLGIGQVPGRLAKYVDAVYPMVYPVALPLRRVQPSRPERDPRARRSRSRSATSRMRCVGRKTMLIPWLEDFSLTSARRPPEEVQRPDRRLRAAITRRVFCSGTQKASTRTKSSSRLRDASDPGGNP